MLARVVIVLLLCHVPVPDRVIQHLIAKALTADRANQALG